MILAQSAEQRIIENDRRIPGLAFLFDPFALQQLLGSSTGARSIEVTAIDYLRYKPGENCLARVRGNLDGRGLWGYAKAYGDNAAVKLAKASEREDHGSPLGRGRYTFQPQGLEVNLLPNDNALPSIGRLADPAGRDALLQRIFKSGPDWSGSTWDVLNYKPERRLAVSFTHPGGRRSVVKFSTPGRFRASRNFHKKLVPVERVYLPVMVGGSKAHHALAFDWREGATPGAEIRSGDVRAGAPVGAALARFHSSRQPALAPLDWPAEARRIDALATELGRLLPELAATATALSAQVAPWVARLENAPSMPVHGDFYPEQAVVTGAGIALIDCDQACLAPPMLDLGSYRARLAFDVLTAAIPVQRAEAAATAFLSGYRAESGLNRLNGLDRFTALGLFQLVHRPFRQRMRDWPELTRAVLNRAELYWRQAEQE